MPVLPYLPLESASGRLVPFQGLDGAPMIALLLLCLSAVQFGLDPGLQLLKLLRGGVLDVDLGQHPCHAHVLCSARSSIEERGTQDKSRRGW